MEVTGWSLFESPLYLGMQSEPTKGPFNLNAANHTCQKISYFRFLLLVGKASNQMGTCWNGM